MLTCASQKHCNFKTMEKTMKLKLVGLAVASALAFSAQASDYQTEIGLGYLTSDGANAFALVGEYNFDVVDASNIVLSEAGFYERSNNVFVNLVGGDITDAYVVGLEYYFSNNIYVAPTYTNFNGSGSNGFFAVDLGYSPIKGLLVKTTIPEENYDFNLDVKYVAPLAGDAAFNLEASFIDNDFDNSFVIGGDYFFNKHTGVGLNLGENTFTISGEHFFTDTVKAGLSYTDIDEPGADGLIGLDVAWRF